MMIRLTTQRFIEVRKTVAEHIERCRGEGLCLACKRPLCGDVTRGVHSRCYHATMRAIRAGKTTMADRIRNGKLAPCASAGRRASNPVSVECN